MRAAEQVPLGYTLAWESVFRRGAAVLTGRRDAVPYANKPAAAFRPPLFFTPFLTKKYLLTYYTLYDMLILRQEPLHRAAGTGSSLKLRGNNLMKAKLTFYLALVIAGSALLGVGEFFTIAGMILTALGLFLLLLEAIKE